MAQMSGSDIREQIARLKQYYWSWMQEGKEAALAVAEIGSPAVPYLLDALDYDHVPGSDSKDLNVIRALGYIGDDRALPALHRLLESIGPEKNDSFRYRILTAAIGQCGDKSVFPALVNAFILSSFEGVEGAYRVFLALGEKVVPDLLAVLDSSDHWIRERLRQWLNFPSPLDDLEAQDYEKAVEKFAATLQRMIIDVLGMIGDRRAVPRLLQFIQEPQEAGLKVAATNTRYFAIAALGRIGDEAAVPVLREQLVSEHAAYRHSAALALGRFVSVHGNSELADEVVSVLIDCAYTSSYLRRGEAIERLLEFDHPDVVPALIGKLADEKACWSWKTQDNVPVGQLIIDELKRIGTPEALAAIETWRKSVYKR